MHRVGKEIKHNKISNLKDNKTMQDNSNQLLIQILRFNFPVNLKTPNKLTINKIIKIYSKDPFPRIT